jgi:hypothetical protein
MDGNDFIKRWGVVGGSPSFDASKECKLDYDAVMRGIYVKVFNAIKQRCDGTYHESPDKWNFVEGESVADLIKDIHKILITE